jgi:hypothetical protein
MHGEFDRGWKYHLTAGISGMILMMCGLLVVVAGAVKHGYTKFLLVGFGVAIVLLGFMSVCSVGRTVSIRSVWRSTFFLPIGYILMMVWFYLQPSEVRQALDPHHDSIHVLAISWIAWLGFAPMSHLATRIADHIAPATQREW